MARPAVGVRGALIVLLVLALVGAAGVIAVTAWRRTSGAGDLKEIQLQLDRATDPVALDRCFDRLVELAQREDVGKGARAVLRNRCDAMRFAWTAPWQGTDDPEGFRRAQLKGLLLLVGLAARNNPDMASLFNSMKAEPASDPLDPWEAVAFAVGQGVPSSAQIRTGRLSTSSPAACTWIRGDACIVVTGRAGRVSIVDARDLSMLATETAGGDVVSAWRAGDEKSSEVAIATEGGLRILSFDGSAVAWKPTIAWPAGALPRSCSVDQSGRVCTVGGGSGELFSCRLSSPTWSSVTSSAPRVIRSATLSDGRAVSAGFDDTMRLHGGATERPFPDRAPVHPTSPIATDEQAVLFGVGNTIEFRRLSDLTTRDVVRLWAGEGTMENLSLAPARSAFAAVLNGTGVIAVGTIEPARVTSLLVGHQSTEVVTAWSSSGSLLLSAAEDGTMILWDAARMGMPPGP